MSKIDLRAVPAPDTFNRDAYTPEQKKERTPEGQTLAKKFPHLEYASIQRVSPEEADAWTLTVGGEVEQSLAAPMRELVEWDSATDHTQDFHCITGWSVLDTEWQGITGADIVNRVRPHETVTSVLIHGKDEFSTTLWLEDFVKGFVAFGYKGLPLSPQHGFPLRFIAPAHLWQYKSCKWLQRIEFTTPHVLGFWEKRAYNDAALVAENNRYADPVANAGKSLAMLRREHEKK